jgi:hypothetical protein
MTPEDDLQSICDSLIGKQIDEARKIAEGAGWCVRVKTRDGEALFVTCDVRSNRINVAIDQGAVVAVTGVG